MVSPSTANVIGTTCGLPSGPTVARRAERASSRRRRRSVASIGRSIVEAVQRLRTYTVDEANRELPRVRPIVAQIAELSALRPDLEEQLRMADYKVQRPGSNGEDQERLQQARDAVNGAEEELLKAVLNLNSMGIQVKGPLEGLIVLPS